MKITPSTRRILLTSATLILSAGAVAFAIATAQVEQLAVAFRELSVLPLCLATALLLISVVLAAMRFAYFVSAMGQRLAPFDALLVFCVGQAAGSLIIQFFGQIVARNALLSRRGVTAPANIALAVYERLAAVMVSLTFASAGALYLFGGIELRFDSGGAALLELIIGFGAAVIGACFISWRTLRLASLLSSMGKGHLRPIAIGLLFTAAIQLCTALAYFQIARGLAPHVSLLDLLAAIAIVMFAASLPISFSGWGVRELSAMLVMSHVGLAPERALAIAITIGVLSIVALVLIAGVALAFSKRATPLQQSAVSPSNIGWMVPAAIPLLCALLVIFQIHVPGSTGLINVNLADPVAILGAGLFLLGARHVRWRLPGLPAYVAVATAVIFLGYIRGYVSFGFIEWAFTNKMLGWLVLLAYGATGALAASLPAVPRGLETMAQVFIGALCGVVVLQLLALMIKNIDASVLDQLVILPFDGFSQNRNAFAFALLVALCGIGFVLPERRAIAMALIILGVWFSGSYAGLGATLVLVPLTLWLRLMTPRELLLALAIVVIVIGIIALTSMASFTDLPSILIFAQTHSSIDYMRMRSIAEGFAMFLSHPMIGAGLGAYMQSQILLGSPLIIHSTPVWVLAEFGIVGFAAFVLPYAVTLYMAYQNRRKPTWAFALCLLVAFGIVSTVHEMLYQRAFWLLLGAALAMSSTQGRNPLGTGDRPPEAVQLA